MSMFRWWKNRFRSWSMQRKMFFTYTASIVTVVIVILCLMTPVYSALYKRQWEYSIRQSVSQAEEYIRNSLDNMMFVARLLQADKEVDRVLSRPGFGTERTLGEEYREFFELRQLLGKIEGSGSTYQVGLYVPDQVVYSENGQYCFPESELDALREERELLQKGENAGILTRTGVPGYLLLFPIKVRTDDGETRQLTGRVLLPESVLQSILKRTLVADEGLVWLTDAKGTCAAASDKARQRGIPELGGISEWYDRNREFFSVEGKQQYILRTGIKGYGWNLYFMLPKSEALKQVRYIQVLMGILMLCISAVAALISYLLSLYYTRRLTALSGKIYGLIGADGTMNAPELAEESYEREEDASLRAAETPRDEVDQLYDSFAAMKQRLTGALLEQYRLGRDVKSAELKALQAQINPHFLYNTLDLINWGAMAHGADEAAEIATNLGLFYRLSLNQGKSVLTIREELMHIRTYVAIENVHYEGRIHFAEDVPEDLMECGCLNIILQPFVENSILHGMAEHPEKEEIQIYVSAVHEDGDIHFRVEDNGAGMDEEKTEALNSTDGIRTRGGYGVKNISFRLQLCFGEKYGVFFESAPGEGTTAHILLPMMSEEEMEKTIV